MGLHYLSLLYIIEDHALHLVVDVLLGIRIEVDAYKESRGSDPHALPWCVLLRIRGLLCTDSDRECAVLIQISAPFVEIPFKEWLSLKAVTSLQKISFI